MTIYVDKWQATGYRGNLGPNWARLVSDEHGEEAEKHLRAFAAILFSRWMSGVPPHEPDQRGQERSDNWFYGAEHGPLFVPHYNITPGMHSRAIQLGATEVRIKELDELLRQWRNAEQNIAEAAKLRAALAELRPHEINRAESEAVHPDA